MDRTRLKGIVLSAQRAQGPIVPSLSAPSLRQRVLSESLLAGENARVKLRDRQRFSTLLSCEEELAKGRGLSDFRVELGCFAGHKRP